MYKNRRFGAFSSSEDPEQLAATVKGAILALGTVIIYLAAKILGIQLDPTDIVGIATDSSAAIAAIWVAYGLCRKMVIWAIDKWNNRKV